MPRGEITELPSLRAHQRASWHMFLVQFATLALWQAGQRGLPQQSSAWSAILRGLVPDYPGDAPWRLAAHEPDFPAFLLPLDPGGLRWTEIETPDALDVLITARNHDAKQAANRHATPEDWILALVSLQTMSGYSGYGKNGIARMNGGFASRPLSNWRQAGAQETSRSIPQRGGRAMSDASWNSAPQEKAPSAERSAARRYSGVLTGAKETNSTPRASIPGSSKSAAACASSRKTESSLHSARHRVPRGSMPSV